MISSRIVDKTSKTNSAKLRIRKNVENIEDNNQKSLG